MMNPHRALLLLVISRRLSQQPSSLACYEQRVAEELAYSLLSLLPSVGLGVKEEVQALCKAVVVTALLVLCGVCGV